MEMNKKKLLAILFITILAASIIILASRGQKPSQDLYLLDWEVTDRMLPVTTGYSAEGAQEAITLQADEGYLSWIVANLTWNEDDESPPPLDTNQPDTFSMQLDTPWLTSIMEPENDGDIELSIETISIPAGTTFATEKEAENAASQILETEDRDQPCTLTIQMVEAGPYLRPSGITDPLATDEGNSWSLEITLRIYSPIIKKHEGRRAPDFSTKDIKGKDFRLSDLRGKVILLEFAHICDCTAERNGAQFGEIQKLVGLISGSDFAAVTVTFADSREEAKQAEQQYGIDWTYIYDSGSLPIMEKYKDYWSGSQGEFKDPTIVLIDQNFNIVAAYHITTTGAVMTGGQLQEKIDKISAGTWGGFEGTINEGSASYLGMFALGILTSVSPCSIVLLVALLSYIITTGPEMTEDKRKKITVIDTPNETIRGAYMGTMFTLGMASVFFILGLFISQAGALLANASYFYLAAGLLLVIFGINSIHPLREHLDPIIEMVTPNRQKEQKPSFFERSKEASMRIFKDSPTAGAFLLGILFTLGWAPCALALIMPAVILLLAQGVSTLTGAIMFLLFGIGHGIVIIPLATATNTSRAKMAQTFAKHGNILTKTFGAIIILLGILMMLRTQGLYLW